MAQVKGDGSTRKATSAVKARNVFQNTENLYNEALVDWAFEDLSIPPSKIIGGVGDTAAINYDTTYTTSLVSTNANVGGARSISIGVGAGSMAVESIAIGGQAYTAAGTTGSVSIGEGAYAAGSLSIAIGNLSESDIEAISIGKSSFAKPGTVALGYGSVDTGTGYSVLIGHNTTGLGLGGIAIGQNSSFGVGTTAAIAIGRDVVNNDSNTIMLGITGTDNIQFSNFAAVAETPAASHTLTIKVSGNTYKLLMST